MSEPESNVLLNWRDAVANVITDLMEMWDQTTREHCSQVMRYAVRIAELLGLSHDEVEDVRITACLHDIGKIGIDSNILNKPADLTPEEYEKMKAHVDMAARCLRHFEHMAKIVEAIRHHHEFYNGQTDGKPTGYPDGLRGDEIPLYARIVAVADAYSAMTSDRPYRSRMSQDEAIEQLLGGMESQFDPDIVKIFVEDFKVQTGNRS